MKHWSAVVLKWNSPTAGQYGLKRVLSRTKWKVTFAVTIHKTIANSMQKPQRGFNYYCCCKSHFTPLKTGNTKKEYKPQLWNITLLTIYKQFTKRCLNVTIFLNYREILKYFTTIFNTNNYKKIIKVININHQVS